MTSQSCAVKRIRIRIISYDPDSRGLENEKRKNSADYSLPEKQFIARWQVAGNVRIETEVDENNKVNLFCTATTSALAEVQSLNPFLDGFQA